MSATTATAGEPGLGGKSFLILQRVGRSLMTPIAVLPAAAILLRLGQADLLGADGLGWDRVAEVVGNAGNALFANLPLIFAVGVAYGFARKSDGSTALAALVGYLVFAEVLKAFGPMAQVDAACTAGCSMHRTPPDVGVFGGIVIGITAALLWQRYYRIKLVPWLAFFGGRRFVPILMALAGLAWGVFFGIVWPPIGDGLNNFASWLYDNGSIGAGIYGAANRALIPTGLHHVLNSFVWFQAGECKNAAGEVFHGDLNCFFNADKRGPDVGIFMTGFFPIMMFALPAACFAMIHEARTDERKAAAGILVTAALTSFVTGVTEPIEFSFLFVAPLLFAFHAILTGVSMAVAAAIGARDGFGFSAGLIDYLLNYNIASKPLLLILMGLVYAVIYYFGFRFLIRRFDLPTPGRERGRLAGAAASDLPPLIDQDMDTAPARTPVAGRE
ncbi:MAG: N-acetylglucosamine system or component [Pseudonocardiales bacterium]|jgi:PTS system N-acetylglucosamine-specific IIC component|nr:N-acetylglucosamine system or component [Pseudonocardiales bacterium]